MLNSFEAVLQNGRLVWLDAAPPVDAGRVIVTVLGGLAPSAANRPHDESSVREQHQQGAAAFFARHRVVAPDFRFNRDELYDR